MAEETTVTAAAEYLGLSVSDTAYLVVTRVLAARVADDATEPNLRTVLVDAASVRVERARRDGGLPAGVPGFRAPSRLADEMEATRLLRRRRVRSQWPPRWEGAPPPGVEPTQAARRDQVMAVLRRKGGRMRVAELVHSLSGRRWVSPGSIRVVLGELRDRGRVVVFPGRLGARGRPSPTVRLAEGESE